ncbi:hypothetical protein JCM33374_g248 [Metschnikowia sp. JCM 33374]|nr:hypothetical protein JCM33374_g248 [Metschnikowia sp. JCM 33374]
MKETTDTFQEESSFNPVVRQRNTKPEDISNENLEKRLIVTTKQEDILDSLPDVNQIELQTTNTLAGHEILESPASQFATFVPEKASCGSKRSHCNNYR